MSRFEEVRARYEVIGAEHRAAMREAYAARTFGWPMWRAMIKEGLFDFLDEEPGQSLADLAAAMQGLSAGSRDAGFLIVPITHCALGMGTLRQEADPAIRGKYLDRLATGEEVLAFAITEPAGGTDAFRPETTLLSQGDRLILNGGKWHITSAPVSSMAVVWASDPEYNDIAGVLIECDWPGVERSAPLRPAGTHSAPVGSFTFNGVEVPSTHVFARGRGRSVLNAALVRERILAGFAAIGVMDAALRHALEFSVSRQVFGQPVASHQHIQRRLVDIKQNLDTASALGHQALAKAAAGERFVLEASQLKMYAVRSAINSLLDAIQVCGSYGLQEDAQLFPSLLDTLCATAAGGTEEAHRMVIMRELVKELLASVTEAASAPAAQPVG